MADKEATVYIVDLGSSMGECHNGRVESDLDFGMRYVWDKLTTTTAAARKTWGVGVIGLSTKETNHDLTETEGYDNISVLQEIGPMSMGALRSLQEKIQPTECMSGDALSAIIVAIDMIEKAAPIRLKYNRKIILITDGQGPIDADDFDDVSKQINDLKIQLIVLGIDFDDAEYGFKEEDKSEAKAENERLLQKLVAKCEGGIIGTMAEAVEELRKPRLKTTRPFKSYDGALTLGDPVEYAEAALSINVERYFMTKVARPVPASTVVMNAASSGGMSQSTEAVDEMDLDDDGDYTAVKQVRTYKVDDKSQLDGKLEVEFDDLAKGYMYGRTAVYLNESDKNITQLNTVKSFSIIGFIPSDKYEPMLNMGETCIIVSRKQSEKDELALSALIHTLYETESMAVARLVTKDMKEPQLVILMPSIEPGFECLYDVPLPFAEDIRAYQFPPLDKVLTITGGTLTKHRLLPTDVLNQAMSDYVDAMDISEYGQDDEGNPGQYAPLEDSFSPMIHRVNQAIRYRALHPDKALPPIDDVLTRFAEPPEALVEKKKKEIETLIKVADLKKVPPKTKGRFGPAKPLSNKDPNKLDVTAQLNFKGEPKEPKKPKITIENSIPPFVQLMEAAKDDEEFAVHVADLAKVIRELITTSTGSNKYERAIENMKVMRKKLDDYEVPKLYNEFFKMLKADIAAKKLGGPRSEIWYKFNSNGLGLITNSQSEASDVSDEEAHKFWSL